tara:strand:- start:605 stop:886 length:282 start_codon:yes stop_codon:yes gene_type:complete
MYCSNCNDKYDDGTSWVDTLYRLGIKADLMPYYDSIYGTGSWDELSKDDQWNIADAVQDGIEEIVADYGGKTDVFDDAIYSVRNTTYLHRTGS